ncbi:MAG: anhydro-N-acetylmuramic acid kinase [Bacteroidota bacterium]
MAATEHLVLGSMSGSSLDGLDLAVCRFTLAPAGERLIPDWEILAAVTDPYPPPWRARLRSAPSLPGRELWRLHADFGRWVGQRARAFLEQHPQLKPELVGSHGHTVFHYPEQRFTTQIGDGAVVAQELGLPTVTELRGADVQAGGQGAPLAPLADKYLFPEYAAFLNLGGIANLSVRQPDGTYLAGDISGCGQIMDRLAAREGLAYDAGGALAAEGSLAPAFAPRMAALPYHDQPYPKSLDNGWVRDEQWPAVAELDLAPRDALHSYAKWLAVKITLDLEQVGAYSVCGEGAPEIRVSARNGSRSRVLLTGGNAHNDFLVRQLRLAQPELEFVVADPQITDFKEAALIALGALLRVHGIPNAVASATGAAWDTVNGALYLPGRSAT